MNSDIIMDQIREERTKMFEDSYRNLTDDMKNHISKLLVDIDKNGEHYIGSTIFYGNDQILNNIRGCLNCLSSSLEIDDNLDGMNCEHRIRWNPSDFIIPDMILDDTASNNSTPIAEHELYDGDGDFEPYGLLTRTASS